MALWWAHLSPAPRSARPAAKVRTAGATSRVSAHTQATPASLSTRRILYPVRPTHPCLPLPPAALLLSQKQNRYEVHTVPDVAALRVPESSMPAEAPAGGQAPDARTARRGSRDGAPRGLAAAATDGSTVCRRAAPPPCVPHRVAAGRASLAHYPARRSVRERCTVPQPDTTFSGDVQPAAAARGCALEPPFGRGSRFGRS